MKKPTIICRKFFTVVISRNRTWASRIVSQQHMRSTTQRAWSAAAKTSIYCLQYDISYYYCQLIIFQRVTEKVGWQHLTLWWIILLKKFFYKLKTIFLWLEEEYSMFYRNFSTIYRKFPKRKISIKFRIFLYFMEIFLYAGEVFL